MLPMLPITISNKVLHNTVIYFPFLVVIAIMDIGILKFKKKQFNQQEKRKQITVNTCDTCKRFSRKPLFQVNCSL